MQSVNIEETEHQIEVHAPADNVYQLLAEVQKWPQIFPPTIHVERTAGDERQEQIHIWATANAQAKNWKSRRTLDRASRRIEFRQEVSSPPVAAMGGTWIIEPISDGASRVRLLHNYRAIDDDPKGLGWIREAVDSNSRTELAALKANVEHAHGAADRAMSFEDSIEIRGSEREAYRFIHEADKWPQRLPHVGKLQLHEDDAGLQTLEMETRAKDGSTHLTKSLRVCLPHHKIAYKQITLPALMELHTGYWQFRPHASGVTVTSQHTIVIKAENIGLILGKDATVATARDYVRSALSANSRATLEYAKEHVEANI